MTKEKKRMSQQNLASGSNPETDALWYRHGIEDVYFQREAQVNFWTILGGIAVAALLTQADNIILNIQSGRWHVLLYAVTAVLLITASWVQNLWGCLILKIRINYMYVLLFTINMISLSVMCLYVTQPTIFLGTLAVFALITVFMQIYLKKSGARIIFPEEMIRNIGNTLWFYQAAVLLCIAAAVQLKLVPSQAAEIGWGFITVAGSMAVIILHHLSMKKERQFFGVP